MLLCLRCKQVNELCSSRNFETRQIQLNPDLVFDGGPAAPKEWTQEFRCQLQQRYAELRSWLGTIRLVAFKFARGYVS